MRILIMGGGTLAYYLGRQALARGNEVQIIDENPVDAEKLARQLNTVVIAGDGTDPQILEDAVAYRTDAFVAIRSLDHDNLIGCQIAKNIFHVPHLVALVNDPQNRPLFEKLGISAVISAVELLGSIIEQHSTFEGVRSRLAMAAGHVSITDLVLPAHSPAAGHTLSELQLPQGTLIAALLREEKVIVPYGQMRLEAQDEVLIVSQPETQEAAVNYLMGS